MNTTSQLTDIGNKPQAFTGDKNQANRFRLAFELYIRQNVARYSDEGKKVALFLSFMQGNYAGTWAEMVMEKILEDEDAIQTNPAHVAQYGSLQEVYKSFDARFKPTDAKGDAQSSLETIAQGDSTVEQYVTQFELLAPRTKYDEEAQIYFFKKGLKSSVLDNVYRIHPPATDLATYKSYALTVDKQARERQKEKERWGGSKGQGTRFNMFFKAPTNAPRSPQAPATPAQTTSTQHVPMDIDAIRRTTLTQDEKRRLLESNGCFYCRKPNAGHLARDCPMKTVRPRVRALDTDANTPTTDAGSTDNTSTTPSDPLRSFSDIINQVKAMDASQREEASALLKDLVATLDF